MIVRRHQVGVFADGVRDIVIAYIYKNINIVASHRLGNNAFALAGAKSWVLNLYHIGISFVSFKGERICF